MFTPSTAPVFFPWANCGMAPGIPTDHSTLLSFSLIRAAACRGGGGRIAGVLVDGLGGRQLHWLVGNDELALQVAMGDDTDAPCRNSVMVVRTSFPVTA